MIELTVKTLDSQNHAFTVEDDITVAQFKVHIADTVNIPADTQRIIYCGRVLEDSAKLSEYDVNGKVVHLVQRAPPVQNQPNGRSASPQPQRRGFRGFEQGNAMYLGSMAFPTNLMESQGIVPPPPTHSLAASRLNVARRMLRKAESVIRALEDPQSRQTEQNPTVEDAQEEVTPVYETRVIVPNSSEPIDEDLVLSAVQNSLLDAGAVPANSDTATNVEENSSIETNVNAEAQATASTTNETTQSATASSSESTSTGENSRTNNSRTGGLAENASRTTEMAELLTMLGQLQVRFSPFLERYQNFMQEDPVVAEDVNQTQTMISRVSEVMHFLGHAYHSLSDIILKVRTPPPRALLCRPILIQQSAVVQTGFPIQLEAQINFSPNRPSAAPSQPPASNSTPPTSNPTPPTSNSSTPTAAPQPPTASSSPPTAAPTSDAPPATEPSPPPPPAQPTISIQPSVVGIPLMPGANVRVSTFPIEVRSVPRPAHNNNAGGGTAQGQAAGGASDGSRGGFSFPLVDNRSVEFFMEVTPENVGGAFADAGQANNVRGGVNPLPTEFLQSIMQMAGQIINLEAQQLRNMGAAPAAEPSAPPAEAAASQAAAPAPNGAAAAAGQNSQARGNTQTHPTTATHTRSTARPHVHLAQHAMQGFDPFLPCNSHHVTSRRRIQLRNAAQDAAAAARRPAAEHAQQNTANARQELLNAFGSLLRTAGEPRPTAQGSAGSDRAGRTAGAEGPVPAPAGWPSLDSFLPALQGMIGNLADGGRQGPTISQLLQMFPPDDTYQERQSIFNDLIMFLSRNLTIGDVINLNSGRLEPLMRIRADLRTFVLQTVLDGSTSTTAVDRGVNRLLSEMQPFLDNLNSLNVRDDIDIVRSTQMLFRSRLPNIINLAISRSPNALRMLVDQCTITARQFCALAIRASANGTAGVEQVFERVVSRYMAGIPFDIQHWTLMTSRSQLQRFMANLSVPESILQPYIVRKAEAVLPSVVDSAQNESERNTEEPMECDMPSAGGSTEMLAAAVSLADDGEPVVIGSESWHSQVPADWVPIITRDSQRQRRQSPQAPFSDAYLSGMPSKRRKIVASAKPQGSLPQVISESVRRAVTASGLASVAPLDAVTEAAAADIGVQSAYRDLLRSSVQSTIQDNEDFTPDRFPNASNYFNKQ